jgi:hypothetical protein
MFSGTRIVHCLAIGLVGIAMALASRPASAVDIVKASMADGALVVQVVRYVLEERTQSVTAKENGRTVEKVVLVTNKVPVLEERSIEPGSVTATDAAGKTIPAAQLAGRLRVPTLVVLGTIPVDQRGVFRDGTLFLETTQAE